MTNNRGLYLIKSLALCASSFTLSGWASAGVIEPLMVTIPGGEFLMGSNTGSANELPVHQVKIDAFKMAKYEVTVKEFRQFVEATNYVRKAQEPDKCMSWAPKAEDGSGGIAFKNASWQDPANAPSEFHPVLCVSSYDAKAYAKWLSEKTGKSYRLPTESEWEYAARAGTTSPYFFGEDTNALCQFGNVFDQRGLLASKRDYGLGGQFAQCDDLAEYTTVVGMYRPNAFGLYDTIGNVGEIVADCEHASYDGAPADGSAWTTNCALFGETDVMQVHRGGAYGSWSSPSGLRSAKRSHIGPDLASSLGEGFRLVMDISSSSKSNRADKVSASTIQFSRALAKAQQQENKIRQKLHKFPTKPQALTLGKANGHYQLSWRANSGKNISGYNVYRSETIDGKYSLIALNINQTAYIDQSTHTRKHSYVVTAVQNNLESVFSATVMTPDVAKAVPGKIEAEDFNLMKWTTVGTINPGEDPGAGLNLTSAGGIKKGSWTTYLLDVKASGLYQFNSRIASAKGSDGFELVVNNKVKASLPVPATGGWRTWQTIAAEKIYLNAGQHQVRIKAIAGGWKLNWFEFEKDPST